jgi:Domain of unknown function (DUF4388)
MASDLKIVIEADGLIKPMHARLGRWLAKRSGLWRLVPSAENLLVFSRLGSDGTEADSNTGDLQFTGNSAAMGGLMDMITFLSTTKRSGALVMLNDDVKKTIFFTEGDVRMATSNVPEDRLGALMYRFGLVTREELREALKQQSGKRRLGRVLIEMGVITPHDLYTIIRRQVEEIFYSVMLIRAGVFYFYSIRGEDRLSSQINLTTQNLLLEGVQRMDEMSYFRERIPSKHAIMEIRPEIAPTHLDELDAKVYALVDGMRSMEEIAREARLGEFEATRATFNLMQQGYVQKRRDTGITRLSISEEAEATPDASGAVVETYNAVFERFYAEIQAKGNETALREAVESFFQGDTSFTALFDGVALADNGTLPATMLLDNLAKVQVDNRIQHLHTALNEFLFFEMFTAGEAISHQEEEALQEKLGAIFRDSAK